MGYESAILMHFSINMSRRDNAKSEPRCLHLDRDAPASRGRGVNTVALRLVARSEGLGQIKVSADLSSYLGTVAAAEAQRNVKYSQLCVSSRHVVHHIRFDLLLCTIVCFCPFEASKTPVFF